MPRAAFGILVLITLVAGAAATYAQAPGESQHRVTMVIDDYDYIISLFPDDYPDRADAIKSCSTITTEAQTMLTFWLAKGDEVLRRLSTYAGIGWIEPQFAIYMVKYYPDFACSDPLTIPLEGKKNGDRIIALPAGMSPYLTLFQQLARRLLDQVNLPESESAYLADHPLLERSPRRFDNLANLLALRTMSDFFDADSVMMVFRSDHWKQRAVGQDVFFDYFWGRWDLSESRTLASYLTAESPTSELVMLTRPREELGPARVVPSRLPGGMPSGGLLGLKVTRDRTGGFRVTEVDTLKAAYRSGLRRDDLILAVAGLSPGSAKELVSLILRHLDGGAYLSITRRNKPETVIIYGPR